MELPVITPDEEPITRGYLGLPEKCWYQHIDPWGRPAIYHDGTPVESGCGYMGDPEVGEVVELTGIDAHGYRWHEQVEWGPRFESEDALRTDYRSRLRRQILERIALPLATAAAVAAYIQTPDTSEESSAQPIVVQPGRAESSSGQADTTAPQAESQPDSTDLPSQRTPEKPAELVTIMQQNVWGTIHRGAKARWAERADIVARIALDNHVDFLNVQEAQPEQIDRLQQSLGSEYDHIPGRYVTSGKASQRSIFFRVERNDKPLWDIKDTGRLYVPSYNDELGDEPSGIFPYGVFENMRTGQQVVDMSIHAVAWDLMTPGDTGGALKREETGELIAQWADDTKKQYPEALVVVAGDTNDRDQIRNRPPKRYRISDNAIQGERSRKIPCLVGAELTAMDDLAAGRTGDCPPSRWGIDNAYSNAEAVVGKIQDIRRGQSDHRGLIVTLQP